MWYKTFSMRRECWRKVRGSPSSKALADLRTIAERLEKQFPDNNRNVDAIVTPMREDLVGRAAALQSSGVDAGETLKSKGAPGGSTTKRLHWLRNTLVAGEIALSLALLIGAGLLLRTLAHLRATEIGVQPANVLTAEVKLPESKYKTFDQRREFVDQLLQKLRVSPGVKAAAITTKLPLLGGNNGYIHIPGQETGTMSG